MARKMHEKRPEEDNRYHDTWKLLKKYRDVTWSLEVSVRQVKNQFRIDYDCSIEDFLDSIYMAGADLGGTIIEVLRPHIRDISSSTYYRLRKEAVIALSSVLWGFSSQDTLNTLELFFPPSHLT